jgi:hypothetical protein
VRGGNGGGGSGQSSSDGDELHFEGLKRLLLVVVI